MKDDNKPYRWAKQKNGIGHAALVTLNVMPNKSNQNKIMEHYSGKGFRSQGYIEEVPAEGYEPWKIAARNGLEYAFSMIDSFWTVDIIKIEGRAFIDTNPSTVGYTVIRAFFDKINFHLPASKIEAFEAFISSSWQKPYKELIPNFFDLTFTEFIFEK